MNVGANSRITDCLVAYPISVFERRGFSKFKKTIYLLETEQYDEASIEMLDSLWAKQTPNRAKELSEKLRGINGHN